METELSTGQQAPLFKLPDLNGTPHQLASMLGKVVVLNFWSAECPWSEKSDLEILPYIEALRGEVEYWPVASNANEPLTLLQETAVQRGLPTVLHDKNQSVADLYGALTTPHLFVIDKRGDLCYQGALNDVTFRQREPTVNYLRTAVEAVLAGKAPDPNQTTPYGCTIVRYSESS